MSSTEREDVDWIDVDEYLKKSTLGSDKDWIVVGQDFIHKDVIKLLDKISCLLNEIILAKKHNIPRVYENLLGKCASCISTLRSIPGVTKSSLPEYYPIKKTVNQPSNIAFSSTLGITAGVSMWMLAPGIGALTCLGAGVSGAVVCGLAVYQVAKAVRGKQVINNDERGILEFRIKKQEELMSTWPENVKLANVEVWLEKILEFKKHFGEP
ncbi:thymidine phosphorylase [Acrasis kona]|uniref:Thymidine phosphorylase n=1 Tax=Acrasis kona TaxID=1008807 RepID=A0AAW2Z9Y6_9EUKA